MKKILIISPHADDEILGCYGYIVSEISKGSAVHIVYGTVGGADLKQAFDPRLNELEKVAKEIGFTWSIIAFNKDAEMDMMSDREII